MENQSRQRGVALVITFLIMTVMLGMVVSIAVMLYSEFKIVSNIGNSVLSLYAAESGAEKTLYFYRKHIPTGASRGFCSICTVCSGDDCSACTATPLEINGCDPLSCSNCQITYSSDIDGKQYDIDATFVPDGANPGQSTFKIRAKGFYGGTSRSVEVNTQIQ